MTLQTSIGTSALEFLIFELPHFRLFAFPGPGSLLAFLIGIWLFYRSFTLALEFVCFALLPRLSC